MILARSAYYSGLWSLVTCLTPSSPNANSRESPTFATQQASPAMRTTSAQEPLLLPMRGFFLNFY
jgi:hypothetical protein